MSLKDKLQHLVYEDKESAPVETMTIPTGDTGTVHFVTTSAYGDDHGMYDKLVANTSPDGALRQVLDLAKPLEEVIHDPTLRIKAALAQAKSSMNISTVAIQQCLDQVMAKLAAEKETFETSVTTRISQQVGAAEESAKQLEAEIESKQEKLRNLRVEIETNKSKIEQARTAFATAAARRTSELEQLRAQFAGLLGGNDVAYTSHA